MRNSAASVANLLLVIVGYLTPVARAVGSLQWLAVDILDLLIIDHQKELKDVIIQLSPFPDSSQFDQLRRALDQLKQQQDRGLGQQRPSLDQEIDHFLALVDLLGDNVAVESLDYLAGLLVQCKDQLRLLYQQLAHGGGSYE